LPSTSRPGGGPARGPAFEVEWEIARCLSSIDLFRYSALTLNSHRIQYDESYARETEGYRNLVEHGPLLASQLMHAAARRRPDAVPGRFAYRAVKPVFCREPYRLIGRSSTPATEDLAIVGEDGGVRMVATMSFETATEPKESAA
jgi:hydroxyacyl-ACP dehydratase HTD2-like protein with hotdog domain